LLYFVTREVVSVFIAFFVRRFSRDVEVECVCPQVEDSRDLTLVASLSTILSYYSSEDPC
jgi:hypothetical protein